MGREKFVTRFQLVFRILKGIVFLVLIGLLVILFLAFDLAIVDVGASILAFIPTGWFILLVSDSSELPLIAVIWNSMLICRSCVYSLVLKFMVMSPVAPCRLRNYVDHSS